MDEARLRSASAICPLVHSVRPTIHAEPRMTRHRSFPKSTSRNSPGSGSCRRTAPPGARPQSAGHGCGLRARRGGPVRRHPRVAGRDVHVRGMRIGRSWPSFSRRNLRLVEAPGHVLIPAKAAGLPKDSVANVSQVITVDREFLTGLPCSLSHAGFTVALQPRAIMLPSPARCSGLIGCGCRPPKLDGAVDERDEARV